jgi:hypothetical protein
LGVFYKRLTSPRSFQPIIRIPYKKSRFDGETAFLLFENGKFGGYVTFKGRLIASAKPKTCQTNLKFFVF